MYYNIIIKEKGSEEIVQNFTLDQAENIYFSTTISENNNYNAEMNFYHYTNDLVHDGILREILDALTGYKGYEIIVTLSDDNRTSTLAAIESLEEIHFASQPRDSILEKEELLLVENLAIG